jgi:hypothetical protein
MRKTGMAVAVLALALHAGEASAQTRAGSATAGGHRWSLLGGETVPAGTNVLYAAAGWPDFTFGYTHGMSSTFDLGLRFSLLYGVEYTTNTEFGMALAVPLRFHLLRQANMSMLFHVDPGLRLYTTDPVVFGFQFPLGVALGFSVAPDVRLGLGLDFHAALFVTGRRTQFFFGPLVGPFLEYHLDRLAVGIDTRFGPVVDAYSAGDFLQGGTTTEFGFRAQAVFAYRLD